MMALILHKTPTAFGFGTMLVHQKFNKIRLRKHLILFSAATPLGSLATFLFLYSQPYTLNVGVVLLFSAGTFLYASMHCLEEVFAKVTARKVLLVLVGMVVPMFVTIKACVIDLARSLNAGYQIQKIFTCK